jgi:F0F1-type ATP synthase assembly protein I
MATDAAYHRLALRLFADFSGTIAVPALLGALFGDWLDERFGTSPRYLAICLAIALVITAVIIVRKAKYYSNEYAKLNATESKK